MFASPPIAPEPYLAAFPHLDGGELVYLQYLSQPLTAAQRRLQGRQVVTPTLDLKGFRARAVVDWIDLELRTHKPMHFRALQKALDGISLRRPRAWVLAHEAPHYGRHFRIRLHEPELPRLIGFLSSLPADLLVSDNPSVLGIEVSVDFYPKELEGADDRRKALVALLATHYLPPAGMVTEDHETWPRYLSDVRAKPAHLNPVPREGERMILRRSEPKAVVDRTITFGRKSAPAKVRVMDKRTDRRDNEAGTFDVLPRNERRARIEVTLRGGKLGWIYGGRLSDLRRVGFTALRAPYFDFVLPTVLERSTPAKFSEMLQMPLERAAVNTFVTRGALAGIAHQEEVEAWLRGVGRSDAMFGRGEKKACMAYQELNRRCLDALANLSTRSAKQPVFDPFPSYETLF